MSSPAFYSDGQSALRHEVEVHLWGEDLRFRTRDRAIDEQWQGAGLRLLEEAYAGKPLRLTHGDHPDAVITVDDPAFAEALLETHPRLARKIMRGTTLERVMTWSAVTVIVLVTLLFGAPRLAASMAQHVPRDWAAGIGETVVNELIDGKTVCEGADGLAALRTLAQELAARSEYDGDITLRVVDDPLINAFAAPGGQVIFFRGLIDTAQSGEQVAGVLAHEVAHVVEHHPMQGIARQLALRFVVAMIIGDISELSALAASVGAEVLASSYSRSTEAEADAVAVSLLNAAGYDADGIASFFELLDEQDVGEMPDILTWLASHPVHAKRSEAVRAADAGGGSALGGSAWEAVQAVCGTAVEED